MAVTGQGATFSFNSNRGAYSGGVTKATVELPQAEVVDVTGLYDSTERSILVPTGSIKGGSVSIDFIKSASSAPVTGMIRGIGQLSFNSPGFSVTRQVILESGSESASVGDVVRGSMRFLMTDYYPG
jgi:hypothetical protein